LIETRAMTPSELGRIAEIDRSERITQQYKWRLGRLELVDVDIDAPRWGEPGEHAIEHYRDSWLPALGAGGALFGAFEEDQLLGFAIYDPGVPDGPPRLAALYVSREHRGRGVGRLLTDEVVRAARAEGAQRLYVSATPTRGTVDFYLGRGFTPLLTPDARLLALEPDDIHMEVTL
jgi:GNAT superfamily N-acetyltransferase